MVNYSPNQIAAMEHVSGNLQIIACAGSGKTDVISRKVANLIKNGFKPENIIAFTFTDKAANEMKTRIRKFTALEAPNNAAIGTMYIGTIHGFCYQLLKEFEPKYANYDPIDERRRIAFLARHANFMHLYLDRIQERAGVGKYAIIRKFCQDVDIFREEMLDTNRLPEDHQFRVALHRYEELLDREKILDFSSMLSRAVKLLSDHTILSKVKEKYSFIIVDEYQDINPIQEHLIELIAGKEGNVTVVGDDDQAIYRWRGTTVDNILTFHQRYNDVKQVKLEENYRSTSGIISHAMSVVKNNKKRLEKSMTAGNSHAVYETGDIYSLEFTYSSREVRFIVDKIKELVGTEITEPNGTKRALTYSDFAILLRSVRNAAKFFIPHFRRNNIPYIIKGQAGLFERPEVELVMQILAYLSDTPYTQNSTPTLDELVTLYDQAFPEAYDRKETFAQEIDNLRANPKITERTTLQQIYHKILGAMGLDAISLGELAYYQLGKLSQTISDFESMNPVTKISNVKYFFGFVNGYARDNYEEGGEIEEILPDAITISTIHQVKGLEYAVVFIPFMNEDFFPPKSHRVEWLFPREMLPDPSKYETNIEDERRLFYVAITRSRKYLYITRSVQVGKRDKRPSEFLDELDPHFVIKEHIKDPTPREKSTAPWERPLRTFPTSYSDLRYYIKCPYDYKMRFIYGFNPLVTPALGYGKQIHNLLNQIHKKYLSTGAVDPSFVDALIEKEFFLRYAPAKILDSLRKAVRVTLKNYLAKYESEMKLILESEKPFEFPIERVLVSGSIDLIKKSTDVSEKEIEVIDFKSEKQSDDVERAQDIHMQLRLYSIACKEGLGYQPEKARIHHLDNNLREEVSIDDNELKQTKLKVIQIVDDIQTHMFSHKPGPYCKQCDWSDICTKRD